MMPGTKTRMVALLALFAAPAILAAEPPLRRAAPPAQKRTQRASAEPTEAQLPPVDPGWRRQGWRAVVPHAFVVRALAPARSRPEANAPPVFWLKGGLRVPILEQRRDWWRVGWSHRRSGWIPAADLQPHATFVLIDVRTGRERRLAAKGEQGAVSDGRFLWSFSDTGITRTSLDEPPAIWSNPVRRDQDSSLPEESVWTPDRSAFVVRAKTADRGPFVEASVHTGAIRLMGELGEHLQLVRADVNGRVLLEGESGTHLYASGRGQEIRGIPGWVRAVRKDGSVYVYNKDADGRRELIHYDPGLRPLARLNLVGDLAYACLSADQRVLAVSYDEGEERIELRQADTLTRIATLHPGTNDGPYPQAIAGEPSGWWVIGSGDQDSDASLTHYTRQGRPVRTWNANGRTTVMSPDGRAIYIARESDVLVFDTARGAVRRIRDRWRHPLPRRYLPQPSDPDTPTHLEVSALTLTPDGRTLILTEWLNGDPEG